MVGAFIKLSIHPGVCLAFWVPNLAILLEILSFWESLNYDYILKFQSRNSANQNSENWNSGGGIPGVEVRKLIFRNNQRCELKIRRRLFNEALSNF